MYSNHRCPRCNELLMKSNDMLKCFNCGYKEKGKNKNE